MRKMFSENQIKNIVNQGIESGEINLQEAPNNEFPLTDGENYELYIGADDDEKYLIISENSDKQEYLMQILGKYLYGYNSSGELRVKGLILSCDTSPLALTMIRYNEISDTVNYKIFDK